MYIWGKPKSYKTTISYFTTTFHNYALKTATGWATRMVKPIRKLEM